MTKRSHPAGVLAPFRRWCWHATASSLQSEPRDLQTSHTALTILSRNASIISFMYPLPRLAVIACLVYAFAASADEKPKGEASDPEVLAVELVKGFKVTGTL